MRVYRYRMSDVTVFVAGEQVSPGDLVSFSNDGKQHIYKAITKMELFKGDKVKCVQLDPHLKPGLVENTTYTVKARSRVIPENVVLEEKPNDAIGYRATRFVKVPFGKFEAGQRVRYSPEGWPGDVPSCGVKVGDVLTIKGRRYWRGEERYSTYEMDSFTKNENHSLLAEWLEKVEQPKFEPGDLVEVIRPTPVLLKAGARYRVERMKDADLVLVTELLDKTSIGFYPDRFRLLRPKKGFKPGDLVRWHIPALEDVVYQVHSMDGAERVLLHHKGYSLQERAERLVLAEPGAKASKAWAAPLNPPLSPKSVVQVQVTKVDVKDTNPKDAAATNRLDLSLVPASATAYTALALSEGHFKYGGYNWRDAGVLASTYVSACGRHLMKWYNGEEEDPDTGVPHLANAAACLAVIIDAIECGELKDDRPPAMEMTALLKRFEKKVEALRKKFPNGPKRHTEAAK